eukprot:7055639-Ditylum_brightwellii.AAC.1
MSISPNSKTIGQLTNKINPIKSPNDVVNIVDRTHSKLDEASCIEVTEMIKSKHSNETNNGLIVSFSACFSQTRDKEAQDQQALPPLHPSQ